MQSQNHDRVAIGQRIRRLRLAQGLNVSQLATRSGVSAGYISEVERGLCAVSIDKLRQLGEGLGVTLETLLDESSNTTGKTAVEIPSALSQAAERLNLSYRATLTLLQGQRSLTARRSSNDHGEWSVDDWLKFHEQVKDYLPEC